MSTPFHQRLYIRIWLAVIAAVVVLSVLAGWLARMEAEHERQQRPGREIIVRNMQGDIVGQAPARVARVPGPPGQGVEFQVPMADGSALLIQLPRPIRPPGAGGAVGPNTMPNRLPAPFLWMLSLVALAVALGIYPIVRRLTKRLETVQQGVERWGNGDLSTRLAVQGQDEVAFLAERFNHSAEQIEALLTTQKTLLESQQSLLTSQKALLANASHELRSPLARIRMGLELMPAPAAAQGPTDASLRAEILRNMGELDQLIEEILLASRLDTKEADLGTLEPVDLVGLAAEECARFGADLQVEPGQDALVVNGVAKLLRRALRNLLENARRYGKGSISVQVRAGQGPQGAQAELAVCDSGPGVPPELQSRIFEAFYRLPGASEREGGVGLGLALVKSIAQRHQGSVACSNRADGGARFSICLPLKPHDVA